MRTETPTTRLRDAPLGSVIKLPGDTLELTVNAVREDGYIELYKGPYIAVTASAGHEIERVK